MEARRLGRTGLRVSPLCLGTMQFGWTCDEAMAQRVMDAYVEEGGIFLDSADVYSSWAPGNPGGVAEEIIGRWMRARGNRDRLVIATKARARVGSGPNDEGLSRKHIVAACEASLRRLGTDYIDLYQAHSDDQDTPLEETLAAFDSLVRQGKVRYVGASNYSAWRLARALWESDRGGFARYDSLQPHYSLAHREEYERELEPLCRDQQLGVIPYSPLEGGFLTGKYRRGRPMPESARAAGVQRRFMNERGFAVIDALDDAAQNLGATMAQVALAWLLARPGVTAPIIGANSPEQLRELLGALALRLPPDVVEHLEVASAWQPPAS
jgi:aryl-alcohol dehydrogenase-like predicted oxidoreductase